MFTPGRIVFVGVFLLAFIVYLIYSYRREASLNKVHFSKSYKIILAILLFLVVQFLIVKMRKFL
jgi:hypothetical membrane protein